MSTGRQYLGVAMAPNGKLYAIGGSDGSNALASIEEYDPPAWVTRASMTLPRAYLGVAAAANGKLYAIGGSNGSSPIRLVEEYDPASNAWTPRPAMPTARDGFGLAAANGKLYAIGGLGSGGLILATVEEYDPATNTWTNCGAPAPGNACRPMPTARWHLGMAAAPNGNLYVIGGYSAGGQALATVEEYNPATNTWTNCGAPAPANACHPMPTARYGLGVSAAGNGRLYAIGGTNSQGILPTVEEYNPASNAWAPRASMLYFRWHLAAAASSNGKLYAAGGTYTNGTSPVILNIVEEYDPATDRWTSQPGMHVGRLGLGAAQAPATGRLYAIGGTDLTSYFPWVEEFTPAGVAVTPTTTPTPRQSLPPAPPPPHRTRGPTSASAPRRSRAATPCKRPSSPATPAAPAATTSSRRCGSRASRTPRSTCQAPAP
jgi:N-acetylneuraminic acid mutarotase